MKRFEGSICINGQRCITGLLCLYFVLSPVGLNPESQGLGDLDPPWTNLESQAKLKIFKIRYFWKQINLKEWFFYHLLNWSCSFKAITEVDKNRVEQLFPGTRMFLIRGVTVRWEVFSIGHANTAASSCWLPCHCSALREMCEAGLDLKPMVACQPTGLLAAFEGLLDQKVAPHRKRSGHYGICRARVRHGSVGLDVSS